MGVLCVRIKKNRLADRDTEESYSNYKLKMESGRQEQNAEK